MPLVRSIWQAVSRFIERASSLGLLVSGVLIMLMGVAVAYGATRRYFFGNPDQYSSEASTILSVAAAAIAIFGVQWLRQNIRVDFLASRFPQVVQGILIDIVCPALALFFTIVVAWHSWRASLYALRVGEISTSAWAVILWPVKMLVPVGFGLLCLVLLAQICYGVISLKGRTVKVKQ
jgi:TRAP-type mannitol/chloroaromatic compound transport system permease small subunit